MKIGKPMRQYVVEPIEEPTTSEQPKEDEEAEEGVAQIADREPAPAA